MPSQKKSYRETEIKLTISDLPALLEKLQSIGAKSRGRVLERNTVFDTDASDFRQRGNLLRLRTETPAGASFSHPGRPNTTLTAKSPLPPAKDEATKSKPERYKEVLEREVRVNDSVPPAPPKERKLRDRGWTFALGVLGLRVGFRYEKYRTNFVLHGPLKNLHVSLDETPVGNFLELEGPPKSIDLAARSLGFAPEDYVRSTYFELYAADRRRRGRPVRDMLFRP